MKRILIIRFSSIGDIILTTPVIRALKQQVDNVEIHYLTKDSFYPILKANPYIDHIHTIKQNVNEVTALLRKQHFDFIVDLHKNLRSTHAMFSLRRPSHAFPKANISKWLMVNFKVNYLPGEHVVDRYFKAAAPLGVTNDGMGLDYFIPHNEEVSVDNLPDTLSSGFVAIGIGGKHSTKLYPADKVSVLCHKINQPVILMGGPEDSERAEVIREGMKHFVFNGCGEFTINQSASVLQKASAVISNDTGIMHIAAALKKKLVSLWGNTIPEFGMYPYYPKDLQNMYRIVEVKGLKCRPCSKIGFDKCPKGHFRCMYDISEDEILGAMNEL
ncbi:MAG: glycosyltransferase family 9 protein [Bacteroidales bacterium]|nr:glycosyltransferase family 9 protein [Bacteroidales bacterium]